MAMMFQLHPRPCIWLTDPYNPFAHFNCIDPHTQLPSFIILQENSHGHILYFCFYQEKDTKGFWWDFTELFKETCVPLELLLGEHMLLARFFPFLTSSLQDGENKQPVQKPTSFIALFYFYLCILLRPY